MIKEFFAARRKVGFYLVLAASLLTFITAIVYVIAYSGTEYKNAVVLMIAAAGLVAGIALSLTRPTIRFMGVICWGAEVACFFVYVAAVYMYISEAFYGVFNGSGSVGDALASMNPAFVFCTLTFLLCAIAGNVGMYMSAIKEA